MNDPNGLLFKDGWYHVFYQWNPYGSKWDNIHWGHMRSRDFHSWEHLSTALAPTESYEKDGCFSGSAIEKDGMMYLFYTANIFVEGNHPFNGGPRAIQRQVAAVSDDDLTFEKIGNEPVISMPPEGGNTVDFRDPKVWYDGKKYCMVLGSRQTDLGEVVKYTSEDLLSWKYDSQLAISDGTLGYMWECPDLIQVDGREILIVSPMGSKRHENRNVSGYIIKAVDDYDLKDYDVNDFKCIDQLPLLYAPQTFSGLDYSVMLGWIPMPQLNSESLNWNGCLSLPRILKVSENGELLQIPVIPKSAFGDVLLEINDKEFKTVKTLTTRSNSVKISLQIRNRASEKNESAKSNASDEFKATIKFKASGDLRSYAEIVVDYNKKEVLLDLSKLEDGSHPFGNMSNFKCDFSSFELDGDIDINIYIDKSVVEVFAFEGRVAMTAVLFTNPDHDIIALDVDEDIAKSYCVREIKPSNIKLNLEGRNE